MPHVMTPAAPLPGVGTADPVPTSLLARSGTAAAEEYERTALQEIDLLAETLIAVAGAATPLTRPELDRVLGVSSAA